MTKETTQKKKLFASKKARIIAFATVVVLVVGVFLGLAGAFPNWEYAKIARSRAINAQYLPDVNKLVKGLNGSQPLSAGSKNLDSNGIELEEYTKLIDTIGWIDSPFNREFKVEDIKNEAITVFESIGVYGKWVHPSDYSDVDGLSYHYYLTYDKDTKHITLISRDGFQPWMYDVNTQTGRGNDDYTGYPTNKPISSDTIKRIDYYYENGKEVVECEIVDVMEYFGKTMVTQYQYLKNVKDTSFTKYVITPSQYVLVGDGGNWGYDVDSDNPHGTDREFMQIDYSDADNISVLLIQQKFAAQHNDIYNQGTIQLYNLTNGQLSLFESKFAYGDTIADTWLAQHNEPKYNSSNNPILSYFKIWKNSSRSEINDVNYKARSSATIGTIVRTHTDAVDMLGNSVTSLMNNLNISNIVKSTYNSSITVSGLLENHVFELLNSVTKEVVQNSYLANNYTKGLKIKNARQTFVFTWSKAPNWN